MRVPNQWFLLNLPVTNEQRPINDNDTVSYLPERTVWSLVAVLMYSSNIRVLVRSKDNVEFLVVNSGGWRLMTHP